jgi:cation-transporting P-type ATPase E
VSPADLTVDEAVSLAVTGLTEAEVDARRLRGAINTVAAPTSRSLSSILVHNLFTPFNLLLGALLAAILVIGPLQDALFGLVLIVNTPIGIVQELRAKRVLDRLAVVTAQRSWVIRSGQRREVPSAAIVVDDAVELHAGDQVAVDGEVLKASALEVDESLVTGEAAPVVKAAGDGVLSGSFVVAGGGVVRATRVGEAAYGNVLAAAARRFTPVRSELRRGINRFLLIIGVLIVPIGVLLVLSQVNANDRPDEAVRSSVAGLVTMVPEGLVLLTSVVFAVAALRFAQRGMVTQELASVEMLARTDVICLDKTGTLTDGRMMVEQVIPLDGAVPADAIAALASADRSPNRTLEAIAEAFPPRSDWRLTSLVPFSSARKWSAAAFAGHGTWVMGAPEVLATTATRGAREVADRMAARGARVVLVARAAVDAGLDDGRPALEGGGTPAVEPVALIVLREHLRPDAADIVSYYRHEGVAVKVISGDHPETVATLAEAVGVDNARAAVDARTLPDEPTALGELAEVTTVFGRVTPEQKQKIVQALQSRGHVVAMTGDGVNDVLALKAADVGVAMGSGSAASRAVARLTLLHDSFSGLPFAIREGRRVIGNLERVAAFFLTKTVYAMVLSLAVAVRVAPFPLLPRQLSLIGLVAIGVPAFVLSFAPNAERARPHFVRRTLRFVVPAGLVAGASCYAAFEVASASGAAIAEARTAATVVLLLISLWIVGRVARPLQAWKVLLILAMAGAGALAFLLPLGRFVYGVGLMQTATWFASTLIAAAAVVALEVALRVVSRIGWKRPAAPAGARGRCAGLEG